MSDLMIRICIIMGVVLGILGIVVGIGVLLSILSPASSQLEKERAEYQAMERMRAINCWSKGGIAQFDRWDVYSGCQILPPMQRGEPK